MVTAFTALGDEFALVAETASETGLAGGTLPPVCRSRVDVPDGGHVSGVFWGEGPPELVFLHDTGESARAWDAVALALGRPSVAIDLPGHGRSSWLRDGRYEPGTIAPAVAKAIRSFAPNAAPVAGTGLGGLTALALRLYDPALLTRLALVNTFPGSPPVRTQPRTSAERFASREEAFAVLAARRPEHSRSALRREILYELIQDQDGAWVWRHHPGHLPVLPRASSGDDGFGRETLWRELLRLTAPAALVRSDWSGRLTAADLARLRQHAANVDVISIPGAGEDIVATQPAALATALNELFTSEARQRPDRADEWYEEDSDGLRHPCGPHHRVDVLPSTRRVQVWVGGVLVAESTRSRLLFETGLPVRYYLPRRDLRLDVLIPSSTRTRCPYKGEALYWSVQIGVERYDDVAWSYPAIPWAPELENLLAFFNEKSHIAVDGIPQERPVTKWS